MLIASLTNIFDKDEFKMLAPMGTSFDQYIYELGMACFAKHMYPDKSVADGIKAVFEDNVIVTHTNSTPNTVANESCCGGGKVK